MLERIAALRAQYDQDLAHLRARYLGRGGAVDGLLREFGDLTPVEWASVREPINALAVHIKGTP